MRVRSLQRLRSVGGWRASGVTPARPAAGGRCTPPSVQVQAHLHVPATHPAARPAVPAVQRGGTAAAEAVQFATVDGFQGRESDVVIFSCVR